MEKQERLSTASQSGGNVIEEFITMDFAKADLDAIDLAKLSRIIKKGFLQLPHQVIALQRDQILYHQGDNIDKIGFILEGVMKCATYTNDGNEINPHYFYEGEIFPEYLLFSGEKHYIYTLIVEKSATLLLLDFNELKQLIAKDIAWCQLIIRYMAKRGLSAEKWKLCNCYGSLRSRIAYMLLEIYGGKQDDWIDLKDNQRIISTKLHISRTAYNQEMLKLEEEGLITNNKSKVKVINRRKLSAFT